MRLSMALLLVLSGLLGLALLFVPGHGSGWKRVRVLVHLLSIAGFAAAGSLPARGGEIWGGIGILAIGFVWTGFFWLASIHRRLSRGGRVHPHAAGSMVGETAGTGRPAEEGTAGSAADDLAPQEDLDPQERELLRRLVAMREIRVSEIATPREEIVYADCAGGTEEVLEGMGRTRHPRIPVADGSLDRIVGVLHAKDLAPFVLAGKKSPPLKGLMRRPLFVAQDRTVASLLELFRSQRSHMAVVVDSYGRTVGLITRADLFRHLSGGGKGETVDSLLYAFAGAGLALVFAASAAVREPIRLPRRTGGLHETEMGRVFHRGLSIHIAVILGSCTGVIAAPVLGARGIPLFLGGLLFLRLFGYAVGSRNHGLVHAVRPLLAPVDGAALLIDWLLSPLLRRARVPDSDEAAHSEAHAQVLDLTRRTVEQVMIPRSEVVWLRSGAGVDEIVDLIRRRPHSRYPVFEGDAEQLTGMLELFDLLEPVAPGSTAGGLAGPAVVVPETMGCDALLEKMRAERFGTAIVIDEFGGVAGLVTLEDLLEVIVGELAGEHETVPVRVRPLGDGSYRVDATLRLDEFESLLGIALPEGDYETLAGLFLSRTARIPGPGDKIEVDGVRMEVIDADERRIRTLHVVPTGGSEERAG